MKVNLKKFLVKAINTQPFLSLGRYFFGYGIPIFMLHRMQDGSRTKGATSTAHLRRCLQYLADNGCTFLSLYDLLLALTNNQTLPHKSVVFTMDDGFDDQARLAAPIFQEFNCPVTIFLITGMLDKQLWPWDDKVAYLIKASKSDSLEIAIGDEQYHLPVHSEQEKKIARGIIRDAMKTIPGADLENVLLQLASSTQINLPTSPPDDYQPMTWDLAREYENKGVHFAPHTISHRILSKLDTATMETEILGSWKRLQEELATPKPIFCYPTGRYCDFGSREVRFIRDAGFVGAVSTIPAQVNPERANDYYNYALPRYALPDDFHNFLKYCGWFEYARERSQRFWPS